jgi:O-antigen ligase
VEEGKMQKKYFNNTNHDYKMHAPFSLEIILVAIFLISIYIFATNKIQWFTLILLCGVYVLRNRKIYINKTTYIYMSFLLIVTASGLFGLRNDVAIGNIINLSFCLLILIFLPNILNTKQNIDAFMKFTFFLGLLLSIYVISLTDFQRLIQGRYYADVVLERYIGNRNLVALLLGISFNFGCYKLLLKFRYTNIFFCIVIFIGVLLTGSRKGLIVCVVPISIVLIGMIMNASNTRKKIKYVILASFFLIASYNIVLNIEIVYNNIGWRIENVFRSILFNEEIEEGSFSGRKRMIESGLGYFKDRPLFGHGIENFRYLYEQDTGWETYSHNNYVELLVNHGLVGFSLYYSFYIAVVWKLNRKRKISNLHDEKKYYLFIIGLLLSIMIMDFSLVSYKWYLTYVVLALGMNNGEGRKGFQEHQARKK